MTAARVNKKMLISLVDIFFLKIFHGQKLIFGVGEVLLLMVHFLSDNVMLYGEIRYTLRLGFI